jgi:hypothetical protein
MLKGGDVLMATLADDIRSAAAHSREPVDDRSLRPPQDFDAAGCRLSQPVHARTTGTSSSSVVRISILCFDNETFVFGYDRHGLARKPIGPRVPHLVRLSDSGAQRAGSGAGFCYHPRQQHATGRHEHCANTVGPIKDSGSSQDFEHHNQG